MRPARILVAVFLAAVASGLVAGRSLPDETAVLAAPTDATTSTSAIPSTAATAPPVTSAPEPTRVLLAGDSVMAGLVPAVEAALEQGGDAEVDFVLTPSILRDPTIRFSWAQELERLRPDVVVMFVGTWEDRQVTSAGAGSSSEDAASGTTLDPGSTAWAASYRDEVVDPWLQLITDAGARVLWIGAPPVADAQRTAFFDGLNSVFSDLPADWSQVTYIDPGEALGPGGTAFSEVVVLPDGTEVRLRQVDGLHLCPTGAQLLAELVADILRSQSGLAPREGWQEGSWTADPSLYPSEGCPPPGVTVG